jgi:hypothetical protein
MIHVQRTLKKEFDVVMLTVVPRDRSGKKENESNFHANFLAIDPLTTLKSINTSFALCQRDDCPFLGLEVMGIRGEE